MHNSPYETSNVAYYCDICLAFMRFRKSTQRYCLDLQKSTFGAEGVAFVKLVLGGALKTQFSNMQYLWDETLVFMILQYLSYDLIDSDVSSVTSRALPTSEMAILAERCCTNRDSAVSSSRRLPTSFGGLLGCLRAAF